jgi:hypothetical protein
MKNRSEQECGHVGDGGGQKHTQSLTIREKQSLSVIHSDLALTCVPFFALLVTHEHVLASVDVVESSHPAGQKGASIGSFVWGMTALDHFHSRASSAHSHLLALIALATMALSGFAAC